MATISQRKATKRYLEKKDRINLVLKDAQKTTIEQLIREFGYYNGVPEFIREAVDYYIMLTVECGNYPDF